MERGIEAGKRRLYHRIHGLEIANEGRTSAVVRFSDYSGDAVNDRLPILNEDCRCLCWELPARIFGQGISEDEQIFTATVPRFRKRCGHLRVSMHVLGG